MTGCLLRLAGHDFMDFRRHPDGSWTGGSDGCINFDDPDNKGLKTCIVNTGLPDVYKNLCTTWSLADFIVIGAEALMARTATKFKKDAPWGSGSLEATFLKNFRYGRETNYECKDKGLMPDAEEGCNANQ